MQEYEAGPMAAFWKALPQREKEVIAFADIVHPMHDSEDEEAINTFLECKWAVL